MPKIIENIREKLLIEAKKQVQTQGYTAMTIRSVASACGVGTGTVYNYFSSKDMLVASFLLEDWMLCIEKIEQGMEQAECTKDALYCMHIELLKYKEKYESVFADANAAKSYTPCAMRRHHLLREQLAPLLEPWTSRQNKVEASFLAKFVAESMLNLTMADKDFEQIASVLLQLF